MRFSQLHMKHTYFQLHTTSTTPMVCYLQERPLPAQQDQWNELKMNIVEEIEGNPGKIRAKAFWKEQLAISEST